MKRIGIVLLVIGLAVFVLASSKRGGYDSVEGALKTTFSSNERSKRDGWDVLRWVGAGAAVVGLVLTFAPGGKA